MYIGCCGWLGALNEVPKMRRGSFGAILPSIVEILIKKLAIIASLEIVCVTSLLYLT